MGGYIKYYNLKELDLRSTMTNFGRLTLREVRDGLRGKSFSAVELARYFFEKIRSASALNAYITLTEDHALAQAAESDRRIASGTPRPLEGIPLGIKDLFCTKGILTTAASKALDGFIPLYESTVTQKLWDAGAILLGKTNLDEFAMGSSNVTSFYGPTINPWRSTKSPQKLLVPGGSSGGSSAAVAAELAVATLGTDTGGSVRQPAAFTGIVGIKPTYGRCSRWGMLAFASSLDQAGPMTKTVEDAALLLETMSGFDPKDSTSASRDVPQFSKALGASLKGVKVGIPSEYAIDDLCPQVMDMWKAGKVWLRDAGAEIISIHLPHTRYAVSTYASVAFAEASSNLARYDGVRYGLRVDAPTLEDMYGRTRDAAFGCEVKRRIMMGTFVLSQESYETYYLQAQKVRRLIQRDFEEAFKIVDCVLTPTTPAPAFPVGEIPQDPTILYLNDIFTATTNLAGLPAISVPAALSDETLPLGLQIIGRPFDEETIFQAAWVLEKAANFPRDGWKAVPGVAKGEIS
jgi:aspartyl-tRNA(Asn)/glutamyl-tRNA(Gln) amidotransferase subunit A